MKCTKSSTFLFHVMGKLGKKNLFKFNNAWVEKTEEYLEQTSNHLPFNA